MSLTNKTVHLKRPENIRSRSQHTSMTLLWDRDRRIRTTASRYRTRIFTGPVVAPSAQDQLVKFPRRLMNHVRRWILWDIYSTTGVNKRIFMPNEPMQTRQTRLMESIVQLSSTGTSSMVEILQVVMQAWPRHHRKMTLGAFKSISTIRRTTMMMKKTLTL